MGIEDFEWDGEVEVKLAATALPVAPKSALGRAGSWLVSLRQSVWLEPALRLGGMALLLGVLAGIGVVATTYAKPGIPLPLPPQALAAALGTSWLKPTAAEKPHPSREAASPHTASPGGVAQSASPAPAPSSSPSQASAPPGVLADGRIVLNAASADELTKLPGVGQKRAEAIVALRTKLKRFRQATDLLRVKGIGPRGLKRMLPHLVLDAPPAS